MNTAYIGLGSNIEPRKQYLDDAIEKLSERDGINLGKISSVYETAPVGYTNQDHFLNMVIEIKTTLGNLELLEVCQQIERQLGREKTFKDGPRTIDLDILFYNHENRELETLRLPHPRMQERAFVLVPLCEIAPDLVMPNSGKLVEDLLHALPEKDLEDVVKWNEEVSN